MMSDFGTQPELLKQAGKGTVKTLKFTLDWRWQRAKYLVDTNTQMSKYLDDDCVAYARAFIRARQSGRPKAMEALQRKFPPLFLAYEIYNSISNPVKWKLEAALITEASAEDIGNFMALDPIVPAAYENVFFNVRPFLYAESFIQDHVIMPAHQRAMTNKDRLEVVLKLVAYNGGWNALSRFMVRGSLPESTQKMIDELIMTSMRYNALSASVMTQITPWSTADIMNNFIDLKKLELGQQMVSMGAVDREQEEVSKKALTFKPFYKLSDKPGEIGDVEMRAVDMIRAREQEN